MRADHSNVHDVRDKVIYLYPRLWLHQHLGPPAHYYMPGQKETQQFKCAKKKRIKGFPRFLIFRDQLDADLLPSRGTVDRRSQWR